MATQAEVEDKIIQSGKNAYQAGIQLEDCPFVPKSPAGRLWRKGWKLARGRGESH